MLTRVRTLVPPTKTDRLSRSRGAFSTIAESLKEKVEEALSRGHYEKIQLVICTSPQGIDSYDLLTGPGPIKTV